MIGISWATDMKGPVLLITVFALTAASAGYGSDQSLPAPNWNREAAIEAGDAPAVKETLGTLYDLARTGRGDELMSRVRAIAASKSRPEPERDRILHELALSLGEIEPGLVDSEVLEFLAETRALVRVPHDEQAAMGVPLYNIRAAAAGSLALWQNAASPSPENSRAPFTGAGSFIETLSALDETSRTQHIRQARESLNYAEIESVIDAAPGQTDAPTASLVMAELSPAVIDSLLVQNRLFGLLADRELGGSAALALARSGDEAVLARLADLAASNEGLASRRASLAIDLFLAEGASK